MSCSRQLTNWHLTDQKNDFQNWRSFKNLNYSSFTAKITFFILVTGNYDFYSFSIIGHSFMDFEVFCWVNFNCRTLDSPKLSDVKNPGRSKVSVVDHVCHINRKPLDASVWLWQSLRLVPLWRPCCTNSDVWWYLFLHLLCTCRATG